MKTIQVDEILAIYKACGLDGSSQPQIRQQINTGTLGRRLNTGSIFNNQTAVLTVTNVTEAVKIKTI